MVCVRRAVPIGLIGFVLLAQAAPVGAAQFAAASGSPFPAGGSTAEGVAVGDLSGDGIVDIAVATVNSGALSILDGNGTGGFGPARVVPVVIGGPGDVALADFNRDGRLDIAATRPEFSPSANLAVLINDGDGTFTETDYPAGSFPNSPVAADVNADGLLDLTVAGGVANPSTYFVHVLLGNGSGGFGAQTAFLSGGSVPSGVDLGDFSGDGKPDIVVANTNGGDTQCTQGCGSLAFLSNTTPTGAATPTFAAAQTIPAVSFPQGTKPFDVKVADLNGDGNNDVAATNSGSNDVSSVLGNGSGGFGAASYRAVGTSPFSIATADFNADGKLDAVTANFGSDNATLMLGNGDGTFASATESYATGQDPWAAGVGDFDRDGQLDAAVSSTADDTVTVLLNTAEGVVAANPTAVAFPAQQVGTAAAPQNVQVGNTGNGLLPLLSATVTGPDAGDFSKASDSCSSKTLFPGATCAIGVGFTPTAAGARSATLVVTGASGSSAVPLTGAGTGTGTGGTLPPPTLGQSFNVEPVSGQVLVASGSGPQLSRRGGAAQKGLTFVPLTDPRQLTVGSFLDTTRGRARITTATNLTGKTQQGEFFQGLFQVLQSRSAKAKGLTTMKLKGSSFKPCRRAGRGKRASVGEAIASARRKLSGKTIRRLGGSASGSFRTRGRHSAATVRGTVWTMADRCDGTLTKVKRGKVAVRDFRRKKTIVVAAGKSYLARAPLGR